MTRDIASILKTKILTSPHPIIDKIAGLVHIVEYAEERAVGKVVLRIPVSVDTNIPGGATWQDRDLVPNSANRSIVYFEDNGTTALSSSVYGRNYNSKLTLVCWMNTERMSGTTTPASDLIAWLLKRLEVKPYNQGKYLSIRVTHESILPQDGRIFARYTYDEKERQFLMAPYEFFGIALNVRYTVSSICNVPTVTQVVPVC